MTKDVEEHQHHLKAEGLKDNIDNHDTPRLLHWLPTAFLLAIITAGAVTTVLVPTVRQWPAGKDIVTGEAMLEYEKNHLDAKVPWRDASVKLWGGVNYRLFGEARDGALIGKDGWLFTTEEFQTGRDDQMEIQRKVAYIEQVRDELEQDGAKLVVALIPSKARVYVEQLRVPLPAHNALIYQNVRARLEKAGIPTPDILTPMLRAMKAGNDVFLSTDTHWTPLGAQVAAHTLASAVDSLGTDLPRASYIVKSRPVRRRAGDLFRYVPLESGGLTPDLVFEPEYTRTDVSEGGLLGEATLAVTLVGTSYSADTAENVWHFDEALSKALGSEVLNAAQEGQGPVVPMQNYLKSQERSMYPPRVVIWEIPERFLRVNYDASIKENR